jgi:hypothetical protein
MKSLWRRLRRFWHKPDVSEAWLRHAHLAQARDAQLPPDSLGRWPGRTSVADQVERLHGRETGGYRRPWSPRG